MSKHDDRPLIHDRIRELRTYLGYSQADVAKYLDIHREAVTEIEAGRRKVTIDECTKLCKILNCTPEYLIRGHMPTMTPSPQLEKVLNDPRLDNDDRLELVRFYEFLRMRKQARQ